MGSRITPAVTVDHHRSSGPSGHLFGTRSQVQQSSSVGFVMPTGVVLIPTAAGKRRMIPNDRPGKPTGTILSTREIFNTLYREKMAELNDSAPANEQFPLYTELANDIKDKVRGFLYNTLKLDRGTHTYSSIKLKYADKLRDLKRSLVGKYSVLGAAQSCWVVTFLIKETMQRDRKAKVGAAKKEVKKNSVLTPTGSVPLTEQRGAGTHEARGAPEPKNVETLPPAAALSNAEESPSESADMNRVSNKEASAGIYSWNEMQVVNTADNEAHHEADHALADDVEQSIRARQFGRKKGSGGKRKPKQKSNRSSKKLLKRNLYEHELTFDNDSGDGGDEDSGQESESSSDDRGGQKRRRSRQIPRSSRPSKKRRGGRVSNPGEAKGSGSRYGQDLQYETEGSDEENEFGKSLREVATVRKSRNGKKNRRARNLV